MIYIDYSAFKDSTGFTLAALHACDKTVSRLKEININIPKSKTAGLMETLDTKNSNHKLLIRYAKGVAMRTAMPIIYT